MKTISKSRILQTALLLFMSVGLLSFVAKQSDEWKVPAEYKSKKNAEEADEELGEELWAQHCKSCHGKTGNGDGTKAANLESEMRDMEGDEVQAQTDGELYYKTAIGRDEMPNYEKKLDVEEVWQLVHHMRTFK